MSKAVRPVSLSVFLHPSKLHNRIAGVYLALLLGVQALSYWFIQDSIDGNARAAIQTELDTGEKVLLHLIDQNADSLTQATRVLAADYGFRSAVASGDRETDAQVLAALRVPHAAQRVPASVSMPVRLSLKGRRPD